TVRAIACRKRCWNRALATMFRTFPASGVLSIQSLKQRELRIRRPRWSHPPGFDQSKGLRRRVTDGRFASRLGIPTENRIGGALQHEALAVEFCRDVHLVAH